MRTLSRLSRTFAFTLTDAANCSMAASFYSSPLIGATTTLACFAHEIPHEIADYSILVRSGFTKKQAMQSQFLTAVGAFVRPLSLSLGLGGATLERFCSGCCNDIHLLDLCIGGAGWVSAPCWRLVATLSAVRPSVRYSMR